MIEEGLLLPMNVLLQGQKLTLLDPEMWFLRGNENKDVTLVITIGNNHQKLMVVEDILLLIDRSQIEVTAGKVIYHPLRIDILSKLLAFIDESTGSVEREHHELFADALPFASEVVLFSKVASEAWFLATYLSSDNINEILFQHLRKTECYKLVRYLLSQSLIQTSLYDLAELYGVSYSHFRRLCSYALGGKVKTELCGWRVARAVLEMIEGNSDMTTIAHKYGYSSSSHFSAEVKSRLGKTPRELCKKL